MNNHEIRRVSYVYMYYSSLVPRPSTLPLKSERKQPGEEGLVQKGSMGCKHVYGLWGVVIEGAKYVCV